MTSEVEKHRLPPLGIVIKSLESVRSMFYLILMPVIGGGSVEALAQTLAMVLVVVGIAVGSFVLGFVRWVRFQYWFEDGQFRVEQGAVFRQRTFIPIEKVQATDITAGVMQRMLGLVQLEIKTGAAGSQAKLSGLTRQEAVRIQARLRQGSVAVPQHKPAVERAYRLTSRQLLLAGATSGRFGFVLGGIAWVFSQADDVILTYLAESFSLEVDPERVLQTDPVLVVAVLVVGLLISWLGAVAWELLTYGGFEASKQGSDIVIRRGIFEQRQVTLPIRRVQAIRYRETLIRQAIGYGTLYVEAVGHQEEKGEATVLHPFLSRAQSRALIADLLPRFDVGMVYVRPPQRALPRFLVKPTLLASAPFLLTAFVWTPALFGLAVLPLVWLVGYVSWRDVGLSLGRDIAVVRSRSTWKRSTAMLLRETTQIAACTSSIFQRRRNLSTVALTVATGPVGRTFTARDLDDADAWKALNWPTEPVD